jgi:flagellar hook-length control protein FliK
MMNTALIMNEVAFAPETCEVSSRSLNSGGKSRTEKGRSFADSAPLAKAKTEQKPDAEAQTDESNSVENPPEETDTAPAPERTAVKTRGAATNGRHRRGDNGKATRSSQPEAKTETAERITVLSDEQIQAVAQQVQTVASPEGQAGAAQMNQIVASVSVSVQESAAQLAGSESPQTKQLPPAVASVTSAVTAGDKVTAQLNASLLSQISQNGAKAEASASVKNGDTQAATSGGDAALVPNAIQQKPDTQSLSADSTAIGKVTAERATVEVPPVGSAFSEISDKIDAITSNQQSLQEPPRISSTATNAQTLTEAQLGPKQGDSLAQTLTEGQPGPNQGDSLQARGGAEVGASQRTPVEGLITAVSAGKDGAEATRTGQETPQELSAVLSDMSSTASSRNSTQVLTTPTPEASVPKNASPDVAEQLGSALRAGLGQPGKQLTVRLQPPELGSVVVRLEEQGQGIKAVLEVSRSETGREIEQALPQVVRNLQEAGFQIRKFEVVVSDQLGKDAGGSSSSHNPWNQQQTWSGAEGRQDGTSRSPWSSWNGHQQTQSDPNRLHDGQGAGPRDGIDLLA